MHDETSNNKDEEAIIKTVSVYEAYSLLKIKKRFLSQKESYIVNASTVINEISKP